MLKNKFKIDKPTSFFKVSPISIFDENKQPFYINIREGKYMFNLPKGVYYLGFGELKKKDKFEPVNEIKLKKPDRNVRKPKRIKTLIKENPFGAYILKRRGLMFFDPSIVDLPKYSRAFIILHELAHFYYKSEEDADLYAASKMLKLGFNASQIFKGFEALIKERPSALNNERLRNLYKHLKSKK